MSLQFVLGKLDYWNISDELNSANESVKRYVNLTQIPDAVYDNIFMIQDSITGELRPKLIKAQNYGEMGTRLDDEIKSEMQH